MTASYIRLIQTTNRDEAPTSISGPRDSRRATSSTRPCQRFPATIIWTWRRTSLPRLWSSPDLTETRSPKGNCIVLHRLPPSIPSILNSTRSGYSSSRPIPPQATHGACSRSVSTERRPSNFCPPNSYTRRRIAAGCRTVASYSRLTLASKGFPANPDA